MIKKATFGAGCFWGVEETFRKIPGVMGTLVGYMGGIKENPTYEDVCSNKTGHAEVVEVTYDTAAVSYADLLHAFWGSHDPTTPNRQGPDIGSQYRSVVYFYDDAQRLDAEKLLNELDKSGKWKNPIVTSIAPATQFWPAEEYHQKYFFKKGITPTCHTY